jgi:hypothetical protein
MVSYLEIFSNIGFSCFELENNIIIKTRMCLMASLWLICGVLRLFWTWMVLATPLLVILYDRGRGVVRGA